MFEEKMLRIQMLYRKVYNSDIVQKCLELLT